MAPTAPDTIIVLATRNTGKIHELAALLAPLGAEVRGLAEYPAIPEIPETGATFEENALIKARAVAEATGLVAVADDSGLVVDALHGAPGVHSARYAGEDATDAANNEKLLAALAGVPDEQRGCRFVSVIAAVAPAALGGASVTLRGTWEGRVAHEPKGENGFGYDPLFIDRESPEERRAAQMSREEKNAVSHRGKALRVLLGAWPDFVAKIGA